MEVGNYKRRTLKTLLSSGTSAGTFACPVGPYHNCRVEEAGTENAPNRYFVQPVPEKIQIGREEIWPCGQNAKNESGKTYVRRIAKIQIDKMGIREIAAI